MGQFGGYGHQPVRFFAHQQLWGFIEPCKSNVFIAQKRELQVLRLRPTPRDFAQDESRTLFMQHPIAPEGNRQLSGSCGPLRASCTISTGLLFNHTGLPAGGTLGLRAVVFDFGMVLSGQPNMRAHEAMVRITGLPVERFETLYWSDRLAYDQGKVSGLQFWRNFVRDAGIHLDGSSVEELNLLDALHWTTQNPAMLAWQLELKKRGLLTGILSNMGDSVLASLEKHFDWLPRFDVLVWSFQLGLIKPDPAIYRHLLSKLGTRPEETLFIDDRHVNVEAARALGIRAMEFTTLEKLRDDMIASGLDRELPLPC